MTDWCFHGSRIKQLVMQVFISKSSHGVQWERSWIRHKIIARPETQTFKGSWLSKNAPIFPYFIYTQGIFLYKNAPNAEYSVLYKILFILIWNSSCCFACQIIDIHTNLKRHKAFSPLNMFYLLPFCSLWRIVNMYHVKKLVY